MGSFRTEDLPATDMLPGVTRRAVILDEPCQVIDAWHPVRDDYR